jgi:hypothetical protein
MPRRILLVAAVALVAGCGGDDTPTRPAADANRQAMLDYARCMRENGIDMPDPQFEGGKVTTKIGRPGKKIDPDTMRRAEQACAKHREDIEPPELSDEDKQQFRQAALEHARCMRENGVENFPDPTFDENGGAQIRIGKGVKPDSPTFRKAAEACESKQPQMGESRK